MQGPQELLSLVNGGTAEDFKVILENMGYPDYRVEFWVSKVPATVHGHEAVSRALSRFALEAQLFLAHTGEAGFHKLIRIPKICSRPMRLH